MLVMLAREREGSDRSGGLEQIGTLCCALLRVILEPGASGNFVSCMPV